MTLCSPVVASGGLADLGFQEEVCYGKLPAAPALKSFRRRSTTLTLTKDAYTSEEIRSDRMTSDQRHGIRRANGDIVAEISPSSHADAYEALLGGVWAAPAAITLADNAVAAAAAAAAGTATLTLTVGQWATLGFFPGDILRVTGSGTAYDGVLLTVIDFTAAAVATVLLPPDFPSGGAGATLNLGTLRLAGARCQMGTIPRSFLFERAFSDIGSFIVYQGMKFNTAAMDLPATGIATVTFGMVGQNARPISGASFDGVAEIVADAVALGALTFNAAAGTITAAVGDWVALGFAVGDRILIDGAGLDAMGQNKNPRTITKIAGSVITVAEAIQSGVTAAGGHTVTRVGLPAYTAAPNEDVLVAASGVLLIDGEPAGTVTAASISIDNGMAGSEVVGKNVVPTMLYGLRCAVGGSLTVLFDRDGMGQKIYNAFDEELDLSLMLRLDTADREDALAVYMPRIKLSGGSIGDAVATGLPVSGEYVALKPRAAGQIPSQVVIYDTTVTP